MLILGWIFLMVNQARAWENHTLLMERLLESNSAQTKSYLTQKITYPCGDSESTEIASLAKELQIDPTKVPLFSETHCSKGQKEGAISVRDLLISHFSDEPDMGMDQNLPEEADPFHYRKWMGGMTGPTSQGFRHMVFPGFQFSSPIETFQIPLSSVGEAFERVSKMREAAKRYLAKGNRFWALRLTLWELHYVQDLHQPFHSRQILTMKFLPWNKIFSGFVKETTHAISNYHYAYEGLVQEMVKESATTDFQSCFEPNAGAAFVNPSEITEGPQKVASKVGADVYRLFGDLLKSKEVDLPNGVGQLDYFALLHAAPLTAPTKDEAKELRDEDVAAVKSQIDRTEALVQLKSATCELMKSLSRYSWAEIDQILK